MFPPFMNVGEIISKIACWTSDNLHFILRDRNHCIRLLHENEASCKQIHISEKEQFELITFDKIFPKTYVTSKKYQRQINVRSLIDFTHFISVDIWRAPEFINLCLLRISRILMNSWRAPGIHNFLHPSCTQVLHRMNLRISSIFISSSHS